MRQPDHEYEERSFGDIQRAIDFENSMNDLESQLYYQHLSPKEVAQQVLKATCQFYDADWCGLIQVDLDLNLWTPFWWFNAGATDKTMLLTEEYPVVFSFSKEPNPEAFERIRNILLATSYTKKVG